MTNLGLTCYVNAVMQALLRMPKWSLKLPTPIENLQAVLLNPAANRREFMHAASVAFYVDVVSKMVDDNGNQLFRLGIQSDPGEFLIMLIEKHIKTGYPHLVPDLAVTRTSRLTCAKCETSSELFSPDTCNILYVELPGEPKPKRSKNRSAEVHTTPVLQLQELVNVCVQQEEKDNIERKCPSCEHNGSCATSSKVETGPVLVMCLKRFQQGSKEEKTKGKEEKTKGKKEKKEGGVKVSKTHQMVEVPLELHLPNSNEVYSLVNIVCHHGSSRAKGHCIAHCRIKESGQFQTFDDHNVKKADDGFRFSKEAYLVTYVWHSILQGQVRLIFYPEYFLPFLYLFLFTTSLF
jgi:ubiquitin C-terminal hydrolase